MKKTAALFALTLSLFAHGQISLNGSPPQPATVTPGQTGNTPAANSDLAQVTGGFKYNGPQASVPSVTPTLNTNVLQDTSNMARSWENWNLISLTGGQPDELGTNTATLIIPTTTTTRHRMGFPTIWEPSLTATTAINLSVLAKSSGSTQTTFFAYMQLTDGSTSLVTSYTNLSTCANISAFSGVTATATSSGNGFCKVGMLYTLPAATYIQQVFFGCSTSTTTDSFAGNGTDGCIISHPMLAVGSSLSTYQDVTSMHRYAAVAYDSYGNTSGISPWVTPTSYPALAEVNSITVPCVSGAATYKVYRTGGYTQGGYPVTCGTPLNDNLLVFDGTAPPYGNVISTVQNPIPDIRPSSTASTLIMLTFAAANNACVTVANLEPGLAGTLTYLRVSDSFSNTGYFGSVPDNTKIHFLADGALFNGPNDQTISFGSEFYVESNPIKHSGNYQAMSMMTPQFFGAYKAHEIPFTNGAQVIICGTTSDSIGSVNAEVGVKLGKYYSSAYRQHWHVYDPGFQTVTQYSQFPILPLVTTPGGGEVENLFLYESGAVSYSFLEANLTGMCDGAQCHVVDGTENEFQGSQYYNFGEVSAQNDHWGDWIGSGLTNPINTYDVMQYRHFGKREFNDSIIWQNNFQMYSFDGQQGEGPIPPGSIQVKAALSYWTAQ